MKDGVKIKNFQKVKTDVNATSAMISFDMNLLISPLTLKDTGVFTCAMEFSLQTVQSESINITVKRMTMFSIEPFLSFKLM